MVYDRLFFNEIHALAIWLQDLKFLALLMREYSEYFAQLQDGCTAWTSYQLVLKPIMND